MEAKRIRLYGGMFYYLMVFFATMLGMLSTLLFDMPSLESYMFNLGEASGNIFFGGVLTVGYFIFLTYFLMMGIVYHEVGHAMAVRHYGMERIFIRVLGLFSGICISCKGEPDDEEPALTPKMDASSDFAGGVLSGAMLLLIYALTQSWGILLIFGVLIIYSGDETFGLVDFGFAIDNIRKDGRFSFTLMDELTEQDWYNIEEEMYLENPT